MSSDFNTCREADPYSNSCFDNLSVRVVNASAIATNDDGTACVNVPADPNFLLWIFIILLVGAGAFGIYWYRKKQAAKK